LAKKLELSESESIRILNLVISCIELQDNIQDLNKNVLLFNPQIVRNAKTLVNSLKYILEHIAVQLFDVDLETLECAIENKRELLTGLSKVSPENWQIVCYAALWASDPKCLKHAQLKALCVAYDAELDLNKNKK
jgi:hypothetical protein